jgi:hypothetical protein
MAGPNSSWSEITTTTLHNRSGKLADNVTKNNALLQRLKAKGKVKTVDGGETIVQELEYAENGTYKRYTGYEVLNISPSDVFTAAQYNYAQAAVAVTISGLEQLKNSGKERMFNLLESRIANAERTMANNLALDCYSDGTADGGKQIGGLQALVADTNTNTIGGISGSTWSFWRNNVVGGVTGTSNIQTKMNQLYLAISRGADKVDLIVADNTFFRYYWESLQAIQRITSQNMGEAGFDSLKFMSADVVFDGGIGGGAPTNHMYFLNTDYLFLRPHRDRNMVPLDAERFSVNQDAMTKLIAFAGNMTTSNRQLQGVLTA